MGKAEDVLKKLDERLGELEGEARQQLLAEVVQLVKKHGFAPDAMPVGSSHDFWFTGKDDVYDRI
jgi:hypothetical protein